MPQMEMFTPIMQFFTLDGGSRLPCQGLDFNPRDHPIPMPQNNLWESPHRTTAGLCIMGVNISICGITAYMFCSVIINACFCHH